jgi:hypothetical protein
MNNTCFVFFLYSERQKYGINSLKIKQNFFQKNTCFSKYQRKF